MVVLGGLKSLRLSSSGVCEAGAPAEHSPDVPGIHWLRETSRALRLCCHGAS